MYPDGCNQGDLDRYIQDPPEAEDLMELMGEYPLSDKELDLIVGKVELNEQSAAYMVPNAEISKADVDALIMEVLRCQ